jgi:branched-subunit amino acid ABC-type transport system permease component
MNGAELAQAIITTIIFGSLWGLLGTGLGLILGVTGRFNFAYAITMIGPVFLSLRRNPT